MKVEVSLFATLGAYLPPSAVGDTVVLDVPEGATVAHVVERLGIPRDLDFVRVVNGHDAPLEQPLTPGDAVSLFPPLAGGAVPAAHSSTGSYGSVPIAPTPARTPQVSGISRS